jgi:DUF4097 and DUF4098 domain-containing protein YvlB
MKRSLGLILVLVGWLAVLPAQAQEQLTVKWNDPSRPGLLKVTWHNGSIVIKTHNSNDVSIVTNGNLRRRSDPPAAGGLRRIDAGRGNVAVDSDNNNVITINSSMSSGSGALEIEVPVKTNLNLVSHNGSTISVEGVEGDIEATNHNGTVNLMNVTGTVVAYSYNGRVVVSFREITPGKPMSFTSMNGNVDVTLPTALKADVKLRTDNGGIWTDFDVLKTASAAAGDRTINGTINGGGANFDLRTHNGNIYLRKAK